MDCLQPGLATNTPGRSRRSGRVCTGAIKSIAHAMQGKRGRYQVWVTCRLFGLCKSNGSLPLWMSLHARVCERTHNRYASAVNAPAEQGERFPVRSAVVVTCKSSHNRVPQPSCLRERKCLRKYSAIRDASSGRRSTNAPPSRPL